MIVAYATLATLGTAIVLFAFIVVAGKLRKVAHAAAINRLLAQPHCDRCVRPLPTPLAPRVPVLPRAIGGLACPAESGHRHPRAALALGMAIWPGVLADSTTVSLVSEQLIVLGTVVGAIAALPSLIEFIIERRKRQERLALSFDDEPTSALDVRFAGQDALLADIADLIDRVKNPGAYAALTLGNEILILGPALSGKKTLARRIAQLAGIDRVITVYNPRNPDALARAKTLLRGTDQRVMLLLPNIDELVGPGGAVSGGTGSSADEEVEAELDAIIETTASRRNVLVAGTASRCASDSWIDNVFGMKIVMPGTPIQSRAPRHVGPDLMRVLREVAVFYLDRAEQSRCGLEGISRERAIELLLRASASPAEIEDTVEVARTSAIHRARQSGGAVAIDEVMLERAIRRVQATA